MIIIDFTGGQEYSMPKLPESCGEASELFILCRPADISALRETFDLDESTVIDCMDIDESVRFTAFNGYDFASLVHAEVENDSIRFGEVNMYISRRYMIIVIPESGSKKLAELEEKIIAGARGFLKNGAAVAVECFDQILFLIFNMLIAHFSDTLEKLEDRMQELSEDITLRLEREHFETINNLRQVAYALKKTLRAFSYIGLQMLCNENEVLLKKKLFLFRNLDTRLRKLYDFSESVYGLSTELLNTYDSKLTQRTNEIVNKLTFVTLIFAPLTLITGIYGMNFHFMPELAHPWAYPLTLVAMVFISIGIYRVMKKKEWL